MRPKIAAGLVMVVLFILALPELLPRLFRWVGKVILYTLGWIVLLIVGGSILLIVAGLVVIAGTIFIVYVCLFE